MPFEPGQVNNPKGRGKGNKNQSTKEIKEAYKKLLEDNLDNMSEWLADVAETDPQKAVELMLKLSEYIIPKLARQELTGNEGEDLFKNITFNFGDSPQNDTE